MTEWKNTMKHLNNLWLIIKYPFLAPRNWEDKINDWSLAWKHLKAREFKKIWSFDIYRLNYTLLDWMPEAWRNKFGEQMCRDIRKALLKDGGLKALFSYRVEDIKEKYGSLRWYDNWNSDRTEEVVDYYEDLSMCYCISCGKPVRYATRHWVNYLCADCYHQARRYKSDEEQERLEKIERLTEKDIPERYTLSENGEYIKNESKVNFRRMWDLK